MATAVEELAQYAQRRGARATGLEVRLGDGKRGLFATRDLEASEPVIAVPLSACLSADTIPSDAPAGADSAPWPARLAACLLSEDAAGSAYVSSLPTLSQLASFHPLACSADELVSALPLCPPELEARIVALRSMADNCAELCLPPSLYHSLHSPSKRFSRRAVTLAVSRTIGLNGLSGSKGNLCASKGYRVAEEGDETLRVLPPLVDLLNHESSPGTANSDWDVYSRDDEQQALELVVKTTSPVEEGNELSVSYGSKPGDEFISLYGFLPEHHDKRNQQSVDSADEAVVFLSIEHMLGWLEQQEPGGGYELRSSRMARVRQEVDRAEFRAGKAEAQSERMLKVKAQSNGVDTRILSALDAYFEGRIASRMALARRMEQVSSLLEAQLRSHQGLLEERAKGAEGHLRDMFAELLKRKQSVLEARAEEERDGAV